MATTPPSMSDVPSGGASQEAEYDSQGKKRSSLPLSGGVMTLTNGDAVEVLPWVEDHVSVSDSREPSFHTVRDNAGTKLQLDSCEFHITDDFYLPGYDASVSAQTGDRSQDIGDEHTEPRRGAGRRASVEAPTPTIEPTLPPTMADPPPAISSLRHSKVTRRDRLGFGSLVGGGAGLAVGVLLIGCPPVGAVIASVWALLAISSVAGLGFGIGVAAATNYVKGDQHQAGRATRTGLAPATVEKPAAEQDTEPSDPLERWDNPVVYDSVVCDSEFTSRVQKRFNSAAVTSQQLAAKNELEIRRGERLFGDRTGFKDGVYQTFSNDLGRINITVYEGEKEHVISKVINRESDANGNPIFKLPTPLKEDASHGSGGMFGAEAVRPRSHKKHAHSRVSSNLPSKLMMDQGLDALPNILSRTTAAGDGGSSELGYRAREIISSCLHQGTFADLYVELTGSDRGPNEAPASKPFGAVVVPGNYSLDEEKRRDARAEIEFRMGKLQDDGRAETDEYKELQREYEELSRFVTRLAIHLTDTAGVYRFKASWGTPINSILVNAEKLVQIDPAESMFSCRLSGQIDVNKDSDYITLDEDGVVLSLRSIPVADQPSL